MGEVTECVDLKGVFGDGIRDGADKFVREDHVGSLMMCLVDVNATRLPERATTGREGEIYCTEWV